MFLWISRILCFIPLNIIHPTFIKGRKNMPKGKAIISSNHLSNWDIALYLLNTSERVNIMAKKELFKNKLFGGLLKDYGGIPIDRDGNDLNAIKTCIKKLKDNEKLFVFPEGTRNKSENLDEMQELNTISTEKVGKKIPTSKKDTLMTEEEWMKSVFASASGEASEENLSDGNLQRYNELMRKLKDDMTFASMISAPSENFDINEAMNPKDDLNKILGDLL